MKFALLGTLLSTTCLAATPDQVVDRGRYLVQIGGCNDCHTAGFEESNGQLPEQAWLEGSTVGFSGPWGVSYPGNLRLLVANMTLDSWLQRIDAGGLPPMPWRAMQAMNTEDRTALFNYLQSLGPAGEWAPAAQPPGMPIRTPHISFVPLAPDVAVVEAGH